MHDVAKALARNMLSENTTTKESDEDELAGNEAGFDLNKEEFSSDFNILKHLDMLKDTHIRNMERLRRRESF
jgi:hypothetical protein